MPKRAFYFKSADIDIVTQALDNLGRRTEDNAVNRLELIAEVERLMPFDAARERRVKAERLVKDRERPRKNQPDGSLWLPGFENAEPYEPKQLIPDDTGMTVELDLASAHFYTSALLRADENLRKQQRAVERKRALNDEFVVWSADQLLTGRPSNTVTFGNFIRERGYWSPEPANGDDEPEGD